MKFDGIKVRKGSARSFAALGGGFGVSMDVAGATRNTVIFGVFSDRTVAAHRAKQINELRDEDEYGDDCEYRADIFAPQNGEAYEYPRFVA